MKTITLGLTMAALLTAGGACAAPDASHAKTDADRNGVVTRAEARTVAAARFAHMDANQDGKLDQADRAAHRQSMQARAFERLDTNKDGQITKAEFIADKDPNRRGAGERGRSGKIAMGQPGRDGRGMRDHGPARHHGGHGGSGGMMGMAKMADADKDGAISPSEFTAAALARFDRVDANKDGQITLAERQAAREAMRARWQQKHAEKAAG